MLFVWVAQIIECGQVALNSGIFNPTFVLLYAYQRPELTKQSCLSILAWPELERLIITIDGLRLSADLEEELWRNETIQTCLDLALSDERIELKIWPDNPGLSNHIMRSLSYVFEMTNSLIAVEDDNLISVAGLRFLSSRITTNQYPQIAAGFNKSQHPPGSFWSDQRVTLFPIQWTTSLNKRMFSIIQEVWENRTVDKLVVSRRIKELVGLSLMQKWRLISYWDGYFRNAMRSPRHTDIVVQYAAFKAGVFYEVPLEDHVEDLATTDWRGMNVRHNPITQSFHQAKLYSTRAGFACSVCDLRGARIEPSIVRQIFNSIAIRFRN